MYGAPSLSPPPPRGRPVPPSRPADAGFPVRSPSGPGFSSHRRIARIGCAALEADLSAAGQAPTAFRLLPAGEFRSVDGRPKDAARWSIDATLAAPIVAAAQARQSDYLIDYEHQSLLSRENGKPAPAAGWFRDLEWREDGLWATSVRWTTAAAKAIAEGEYRYVSPVFSYDPQSGEVLSILCAALVGNPGLDGLTDLSAIERCAASLVASPGDSAAMDEEVLDNLLSQLRYLFNLPTLATDADILAELQKVVSAIQQDQAADAQEGAQAQMRVDLVGYLDRSRERIELLQRDLEDTRAATVPKTQLVALQAQIEALKSEALGREVDQLVKGALIAGRLLPAQEAWARSLGANNLASLQQYLDTTGQIAALSGMQSGGKEPHKPLDDPREIARLATEYQDSEAKAGRKVSIEAAVAYVLQRN